MNENGLYDVAIAGGGLAGLSLAIQLGKAKYKVALFEKEKYPFHKVCGEYISMESWEFIEQLGLPLSEMNLPVVDKLIISSPNGKKIESPLDPGGFGISRYLIDNELYKICSQCQVDVYEEAKVNDIIFENELFTIKTSLLNIQSKMAVASFGKRSNLDVKWSRKFTLRKANKLNNYIAVKYHIKTAHSANTIALHNFKGGYCGISKIEEDKYCLCYLTTAKNLKDSNNSISQMEKNILQQNPFLKKTFSEAKFLYQSPLTISQISFEKKSLIQNHILLAGDAAGLITPLCGNGMSMALQASKLAFKQIDLFLKNKINRTQMESQYSKEWNKKFSSRLQNGRLIQSLFGKKWITNLVVLSLKKMPFVVKRLIRSTHGDSF